MAPSIDQAGLNVDTLDIAVAELDAEFLAEFGTGVAGIDLSPRSYTGRQNPILARRNVLLQQLLAEVLSLLNLDNAQGRFLDFIGTLLNESRLPASRATILASVFGTPGFVVGDRRVRYLRNNTIWRVPIGTVIGGNGAVKVTLTADVAGETLPDGTTIQAFQDGSDQWVIVDTSPSFTAVESLADSVAGRNTEGSPSYRTRLRGAGRGSGFATQPGVTRALQRVSGATASIDNNRGLLPNANGVPGKSIESLVEEGSDADVAQTVLDAYSDSAGFYGTTTAEAFINGVSYSVSFTRVERVRVEWDVTINTAGAETTPLPDNAEAIVINALATYTNTTLTRGLDVQPAEGEAAIRSAFAAGSIPAAGLTILVGLYGGVLGAAAVPITYRQRARTDPEPQAAEILGTLTQLFNIVTGQVIVLAVNGGTAQAVVFVASDFVTVSAATALEVATAINNRTSGIVAGTEQGALVLSSETTGATSSLQILATSTPALLVTLGLSTGIVFGSDGDIAVTIL
jgi:uncharacterized phage protein gp47/JayE